MLQNIPAHFSIFMLAEKLTVVSQLTNDFLKLSAVIFPCLEQDLDQAEREVGSVTLLQLLLTALRLCIRERVALEPTEHASVLAALMRCVAPPAATAVAASTQEEVALEASRCLLNLLHLSTRASDLFVRGLHGVQWLTERLWRGGRPGELLYATRTLYMLCSARCALPTPPACRKKCVL